MEELKKTRKAPYAIALLAMMLALLNPAAALAEDAEGEGDDAEAAGTGDAEEADEVKAEMEPETPAEGTEKEDEVESDDTAAKDTAKDKDKAKDKGIDEAKDRKGQRTGSGSTAWKGHGADEIAKHCPKDVAPFLKWVLVPGGPFVLSNAVLDVNGDEHDGHRHGGKHGAVHFSTDYYKGAAHGKVDASASFDWKRVGKADHKKPKVKLVVSKGCAKPAPQPKPDPVVTVTFEKDWVGDDEFDTNDVEAWLTIDGKDAAFGQTINVTGRQGESLPLEEHVIGLPDTDDMVCTYESDMPSHLEVPHAKYKDIHLEIDVTNDVTCVIDDVVERHEVTVTFDKTWVGDDELDHTGVEAWLTVDGHEVAFGETIDLTDHQGHTLALAEHVTGLPDGDEVTCTYESDLADHLDVPHAKDEDVHLEIDVTNAITCVIADVEEVEKVVEVERVEVLGVAAEREELPVTGAPLAALFAAGLLSLFVGGTLTRRRSR